MVAVLSTHPQAASTMAPMTPDLSESWSLGGVEIPSRLVLAPMAGVSVQAFRRQGRRYGAGLVCSEMVSVAGIKHRNERTLGYLRVAADEHPLAIQILGSEPSAMAEAAELVTLVDVPVIASGDIVSRARAQSVLATTGAAAVMVGRAAQGNPWALREIMGDAREPSREEVVAELLLFIQETVRELGEQRASGFLKKFYGWYLGHGRFPRAFKSELTQIDDLDEIERRLLAAAPGAAALVDQLLDELPVVDDVLLDGMPISIYGGG